MPAPPFKLTPHVLSQVAEICGQVGRLDGANWGSRPPHLRKDRRIQSIHSSLAIENNTLSLDQVTAVIYGKKVLGLEREIQEVKNAFRAYEDLGSLQPTSTADFLSAHSTMLSGIKEDAGQFRTQGVGIYRGSQLVHMAPPADRVTHLVDELFSWLKTADIHPLVASTVVHYEIEFIHPFSDGNGRTGRVLNSLFLIQEKLLTAPILYLSRFIIARKADYYRLLLDVTRHDAWEPWVMFILDGVEETSTWTTAKIGGICRLADATIDYVRRTEPKVYSRELVDVIFEQPYCRIANLEAAGIAKRQTASKYLKALVDRGVLEERAAGREKLFIHPKLMQLLVSDDNEFSPYD